MQTNEIQTQPNFLSHNGEFISTNSFVENASKLKAMTCEAQATMLKIVALVPREEMPVSEVSLQKLIIFLTESCEVLENTQIKQSN